MKRSVILNGQPAELDLQNGLVRFTAGEIVEARVSCVPLAPGLYSVLLDGRAHRVAVAPRELSADGHRLEAEVFDPRDRRGSGGSAGSQGAHQVTSPMPGKVIRVLVSAGDEVAEGQGLIVVEAMKMQNEMRSPKSGRVKEVRTRAEATVAAGDILMVVE